MYYVALDLIAALMLYLSWRRGVTPVKLGLLLTAGVLINAADILFAGFLRWYAFRPGLIDDYWRDNYLGMLLGDYLFVPVVVSTLVATARGWLRLAIAGAVVLPFALIEYTFEKLGMFAYHGWQLWMSFVAFPPMYVGLAHLSNLFERRAYAGWYRRLMVTATVVYLWLLWGVAVGAAGRLVAVVPPLPWDYELCAVTGGMLLYLLPFLLVTVPAILYRRVRHWRGLLGYGLVVAVWTYLIELTGWRQHHPFWLPMLDALSFAAIAAAASRIDRWFEAHDSQSGRA
ncbi:MAG TPA: hypothetical protein VNT01_13055 [Symbiobacteriaceae bacterium]|nr:hypothetical protein [Symbiobacteriaceae bacterium]